MRTEPKRKLTMEVSAELIEKGFSTANIIDHAVVTKGLPRDAKLVAAGLNQNRDLELHFECKKSEEPDGYIYIEITTLRDA